MCGGLCKTVRLGVVHRCCTTPKMRRTNLGSAAWYPLCGGVSELADEHDLGSCAARRAGSSPAFPTSQITRILVHRSGLHSAFQSTKSQGVMCNAIV